MNNVKSFQVMYLLCLYKSNPYFIWFIFSLFCLFVCFVGVVAVHLCSLMSSFSPVCPCGPSDQCISPLGVKWSVSFVLALMINLILCIFQLTTTCKRKWRVQRCVSLSVCLLIICWKYCVTVLFLKLDNSCVISCKNRSNMAVFILLYCTVNIFCN